MQTLIVAKHDESECPAQARARSRRCEWRRPRGSLSLGPGERGRIPFKAEASAWTPSAVQLQQVWTDPEMRGRGHARRALQDLCRLLLESTPCVCLFVRAENEPAIRLYESVGMKHSGYFRSIVL